MCMLTCWSHLSLSPIKACVKHAHDNNVSPKDFEVFNVHCAWFLALVCGIIDGRLMPSKFADDDCSTAWTFCRHRSASLSQIDMIDLFGRYVPHSAMTSRNL